MGKRFDTLDGLRGLAALAIVVLHAPEAFGGNPFATSYLAVDFFFLLSGFVLAHAYERRFRAGMGAQQFMVERLLRFYPLYALGVAISVMGIGGSIVLGFSEFWNVPDLITATGFNAAFLPSPVEGRALFAMNPPAWSLFFEVLINLVWVLTFRWLSTRVLIGVVTLAAVVLIGSVAVYGSLNTGYEWASFAGGLARVAFSFPAGVLIYRLTKDAPPLRLHPVVPAVALMLALVPVPGWYDLVAALLIFPAILIVGARIEAGRSRRVLSFLGLISYPVYALHFPVLMIVNSLVAKMGSGAAMNHAPWLGLGLLVLLIVGSWGAVRFYDEPIRKLLGQRKPVPAAAP